MLNLNGKKALVTGARQGIGAETALTLAEHGAHVAVSGRKIGDCAQVVERITATGGKAFDHALARISHTAPFFVD